MFSFKLLSKSNWEINLFALVTISRGPLKISLFEPWNVATANLSKRVLGSDLRELISLNASIADRFLSLKSEILVSNSESKFLMISLTLLILSASSAIRTSLSFCRATIYDLTPTIGLTAFTISFALENLNLMTSEPIEPASGPSSEKFLTPSCEGITL